MNSYQLIEQKIQAFIKKYYTSRLVKGIILFLTIGLLYFLITLLLEYFLWLTPIYRSILLAFFIGVEVSLAFYFIGIPLSRLLGIKKGINKEKASALIGVYFPEVSDKLLNLIQLNQEAQASELLQVSIEQKASLLAPIPFKIAVNYKENIKYLKFLVVPIFIFLLFQLSGNQSIITNTYTRIINPTVAYTPPAPFHFSIVNSNLEVIQSNDFKLEVSTKGNLLPSQVEIHFNDEHYFLTKNSLDSFNFTFTNVSQPISFYLKANGIISSVYDLTVIEAPSISNFKMFIYYPNYTSKKDEWITNTGNATIPYGSTIAWHLNTSFTDQVEFSTKDSSRFFLKNDSEFKLLNTYYNSEDYVISTTNSKISNYENLSYHIEVIPDNYPEIHIETKTDSLNNQIKYHLGNVSDDYGIIALQLIYYETGSSDKQKLPIAKGNIHQFNYIFPSNLELEKGKSYQYYFEVFDNDRIRGPKSSTSPLFTYNVLTDTQIKELQLNQQKEFLSKIDEGLDRFTQQNKDIKDLQKLITERKELDWNDKQKVSNFIQKQQEQKNLFKKFNKQLKDNLNEFEKENSLESEELKNRLQSNDELLQKNEDLLEELQKLQDKINEEDLVKRLDKLSKQQTNTEKSLEQILELTKRFYVAQKSDKIAQELSELAKKQNELSEKDSINSNDQKAINDNFDKLKKDLDDLQNENKELKNPMSLGTDKEKENSISKDLNESLQKINNKKTKKTKSSQKSAAKKMEQLSMQMQQQMQMSSQEELKEDAESLRKILDNLLIYSFDQEALLTTFKNEPLSFNYSIKIKKQYNLKENFKHIDDSLFALSLRQPKIANFVTNEVTNIHYNIDQSLDYFSDSKTYQGVAKQQYAITSANNLANFLSSILQQMQNQMNSMPGMGQCDKPGGSGMPSPGSSGEGEIQLQDIIQKQHKLGKKAQDGFPKQSDSGSKKGNSSGNSENKGSGIGNKESEMLYEIYKEQENLRNQLKFLLRKNGQINKHSNLLKQMDEIQNNLLDTGVTESLLQKMNQLQYKLLELDEAVFKQGKDHKRESKTITNSYNPTNRSYKDRMKQYFKEVEILNRQALPLQPIYKKKVKRYFKNESD